MQRRLGGSVQEGVFRLQASPMRPCWKLYLEWRKVKPLEHMQVASQPRRHTPPKTHTRCGRVFFFFFPFISISWRLIYNIVVGFFIHWHESAMDLHVFPIPIPPPTSLSTQSLWVFPVHQPWALVVSCILPGLVICFTTDNIHVSMLFSWNIPP